MSNPPLLRSAVPIPCTAGLYIHIPFCDSICAYCHFARTDRHDSSLRRRFASAVVQELALRRHACGLAQPTKRLLGTCYLGGGTPSVLESELMAEVLAGTLATFTHTPDLEVTAEANPETLTSELARSWRGLGINRVSLGIQSLDDGVLKLLGRACDGATGRRALVVACQTFDRVSADWILGPGIELEHLLADLSWAVDRGVEHFSLYLLELHPGTRLQEAVASGKVVLPPDSEQERLYLAVCQHLAGLGIEQYEVANFARPGQESRHNQNYWRRIPYLALGPGAHGYYGKLRYANTGNIEEWLQALEKGHLPPASIDPLDHEARRLERVILALRTVAGVPARWLPSGFDPEPGLQEGLWSWQQDRLVLSPTGFLRIDSIEEFLVGLLAHQGDG